MSNCILLNANRALVNGNTLEESVCAHVLVVTRIDGMEG